MAFISRIFGGGGDERKKQERLAAQLREQEQARLVEQREREAVAAKEASELKFAEEAGRKRRLRRGRGPQTIFTTPLGLSGGGQVESKTFLGA